MTLDELLKQNKAWLEQALKRPLFDQVDEKAIDFPEEQRKRRIAEGEGRSKALSRRKEEAAASFDRAIALEKRNWITSVRRAPTAPTIGEAQTDNLNGRKAAIITSMAASLS
jgi:hypothetical protein